MKNRLRIVTALCLLTFSGMLAQGTLPPVPTELTAALSSDATIPVVKLGWNVPAGTWGFIIYRSVDDSSHFQKLGMANTTVYYDRTVSSGHTYFYYVTSVAFSTTDTRLIQSGPSNIAWVRVGPTPERPIGVIAGTVADDTTGKPIRGVRVLFYRIRSSLTAAVVVDPPSAITDSLGFYAAKLDTGRYKVKAEPAPWMPPGPPPYVAEWFDNKPDMVSADMVAVIPNASVKADFGLSRVLIPTIPRGTITGKVIDDATHEPLPGIMIRFFRKGPSITNWQPVATTDSLGVYTMLLDTGVYLLKTESLRMSPIDYIHEWFDNVTDPAKATPVAVRAGSTFEANFGLSKPVPPTYATIEGYVTDTLGNPLRRATVAIMHPLQILDAANAASLTTPGTGDESMDVEGVGYCRGVVWKGYTDSLGYYKARVISDRAYIAMAAKWGYRAEYYDNKPNPLLADIIKVPTNIKSINFELASNPVVHNSISGVVRDSLGNEVVSRIVLFPTDPTGVRMPIRFGHTDSTGAYTIGDVRLGTYIVLAVPFGKYAPAFYKKGAFGVIYWKMADRVLVNGDVTGIDIGVVPINSFGYATLSGTVTTGTTPLPGVRVMATSASGAVVGYGLTDGAGAYSIAAVPPGPTTIAVDCPDYTSSERVVTVPQDGFSVNNVNFTLQPDATTDVSGMTQVPEMFALNQNYPNPFNPSTTITFDMPVAGYATLTVFNMLGQEIQTLQNGNAAAGRSTIVWNATDHAGQAVASGVYFYRLTVSGANGKTLYQSVQKMMLMR